jgi:Transcriptional regulators of sugar metabolism
MKNNRLEQIEWILSVQKEASVVELASMLKVSDMTIRRDLIELEQKGVVTRYHGGAFISAAEPKSLLPAYHPESCPDEKAAIGREASRYLKEILFGKEINSVILMSGSTMMEMVKCIDYTIPVTAVTDNLSIAYTLSQNANNSVMLLGGKVYPPSMSVNGFLAEQMLNYLSVDCTFMGTSAIDGDGCLYCYDDKHASFLEKLLLISHRIIVLADHTKLGATSLVKVGLMDESFTVITNDKASRPLLEKYESMGVKIMMV